MLKIQLDKQKISQKWETLDGGVIFSFIIYIGNEVTFRQRQMTNIFAENISKCIFLPISIQISLTVILKGLIENKPSLLQKKDCHEKRWQAIIYEPMMV